MRGTQFMLSNRRGAEALLRKTVLCSVKALDILCLRDPNAKIRNWCRAHFRSAWIPSCASSRNRRNRTRLDASECPLNSQQCNLQHASSEVQDDANSDQPGT